MMNSDRDSFSHLRKSDAKTHLEEFNKRFDELKSKFPQSRTMFEPSTSTTNTRQQHPWAGSVNNANLNPNNNVPINQQQNVGADSQHQSHQQSQYHSYNPIDNMMNDPRFHTFMHDEPFFRSRFHDKFSDGHHNFDKFESDQQQKEHRIHHIPIHVEPRTTSTATTATSRSREHSPMPSTAASNYQPLQPTSGQQLNMQYASTPPPFEQPPSNNEFFTKSPAIPRVVRSVPIQVCKSTSSSSTVNERSQPSSQQQSNEQEQQIPVNASVSDPAIADPNKIYAMSYDPLKKVDQSVNNMDNDRSEEANNKLPEVVALAYEPPMQSQKIKVAYQQQADVANSANENGDNINISQANDNNEKDEKTHDQQQQQQKETPFDYVNEILQDLKDWEQQVYECQATSADDKGYRWLDEMLTLCILRLDCINIDGDEKLRKYRKQAINEVNRVVALLELKIKKQDDSIKNKINDERTSTNNVDTVQPSDGNQSKDSKNKKDKDKKKEGNGKRMIFFKKKNNNPQPGSMDTDRNNNSMKSENTDQTITGTVEKNAEQNSVNNQIGQETEV